MIVKLNKPKLLADAISIVSEVVTEVKIRLLEEGMSIIAVDPANVAMVIFKIPKESFSQYESGSDVWGINLDDLKRVLKRASSGASLVMEQDENQLKISIFDKVKRIFNLALIEVDSEDKKEPNLDFSCNISMDSESFSQAIEDCAVVADSCEFLVGKDFFVVEGSGSLNSARAEFSGDDAKVEGVGKARYSLEYLMKFIKAKKLSERVELKFSEDHPLSLAFPGNAMGIRFILAPRVEND